MRQLSLGELLDPASSSSEGPLEVYDLFCGAGGFSEGARAAGCRIVLGVDSDPVMIETYKANHPNARVLCLRLPVDSGSGVLPLPEVAAANAHIHASPPFPRFNKRKRGAELVDPVLYVEWFLKLVVRKCARSWSLEQLADKRVIAAVELARRRHPAYVNYEVFRFEQLGVPQTRRRLVAGSPHLIARLLRAREEQPRLCRITDAIAQPRGELVRSSGWWKRYCSSERNYALEKQERDRALTSPAPTIVTAPLYWVTPHASGARALALSVYETALLQCFTKRFRWPAKKAVARRMLANATPPRVAALLLGR